MARDYIGTSVLTGQTLKRPLYGLLIGLVLVGTLSRAGAEEFLIPQFDISFGVNLKFLDRALGTFEGTEYRASKDVGLPWCKTPQIIAKWRSADITGESRIRLGTVQSGVSLSSTLLLRGDIEDCASGDFIVVECNASVGVTSLDKAVPFAGSCKYAGRISRLPIIGGEKLSIGDPIGPFLEMNSSIEIRLSDTRDISAEFGRFEGNMWIPDEKPKSRSIRVYSSIHGSGPDNVVGGDGDLKVKDMTALVGNFVVDERFFLPTDSLNEAAEHYELPSEFDPDNTLFQISLSDSFFAKTTIGGSRSGLFNSLLPIKLSGSVDGRDVEIALTDADAKFAQIGGKDVIAVGFKVRSISTGAYIQRSSATMLFSIPNVQGNQLVTELVSARVQVDTKDFDGSICLDWLIDDNFQLELFSLANFSEKIDFELDDCLEFKDDEIIPERTCSNGKSRGAASRHGMMNNVRLTTVTDHISVFMKDASTLVVDVPGKIELIE